MPLPSVPGWLIDYRTAHTVFASLSNRRIDHLIARCQARELYISHHEESRFSADPLVKGPFLKDQCCIYEPDDDVYERCPAVRAPANGKKLLVGNEAAVFITAIAISRNFGVISDHKSKTFSTVHDFCATYGVPVLTSAKYFSLL